MAGILALIAAGLGSRIVLDQNCTDCPYPGKCLGKTDCEEYGNRVKKSAETKRKFLTGDIPQYN